MAAKYEIVMNHYNGTDYDILYPETTSDQVLLSNNAKENLKLTNIKNATLDNAVYKITSDGAAFQVGDTLTTARTNLGGDWLLCNGEVVAGNTYPKLLPLLSTYSVSKVQDATLSSDYANNQLWMGFANNNLIWSTPSNTYWTSDDFASVNSAISNGGMSMIAWNSALNKYIGGNGMSRKSLTTKINTKYSYGDTPATSNLFETEYNGICVGALNYTSQNKTIVLYCYYDEDDGETYKPYILNSDGTLTWSTSENLSTFSARYSAQLTYGFGLMASGNFNDRIYMLNNKSINIASAATLHILGIGKNNFNNFSVGLTSSVDSTNNYLYVLDGTKLNRIDTSYTNMEEVSRVPFSNVKTENDLSNTTTFAVNNDNNFVATQYNASVNKTEVYISKNGIDWNLLQNIDDAIVRSVMNKANNNCYLLSSKGAVYKMEYGTSILLPTISLSSQLYTYIKAQ